MIKEITENKLFILLFILKHKNVESPLLKSYMFQKENSSST